jgi:hypothetical protein
MCRRERDKATCRVFATTAEERETLRAMGEVDPPEEYVYCRPCFRMLEDPERAANLMKGVVEVQLRSIGVPNAGAVAEKFKQRLLAQARSKNLTKRT